MGLWNTEFGGALFEGLIPPDFTEAFDTWDTITPQLVNDAGANNVGTYVLQADDVTATEKLLRWTRPEAFDDLLDTDQLLLWRPGGTAGSIAALWARASGAAGSEEGYYAGVTSTQVKINEMSASIDTPIVTVAHGITITIGVWYWLQFRVEGARVRARVWTFGATPPNWQLDTTDSTHTAAGWVGPGSVSSSVVSYDWYSLATEGDHPDMSLGGAVAPSNDNVLIAIPSTVPVDGTSFLVYTGQPNKAIDWTLTGDGTLTVLTDQTDAGGKAWARYTPGTVGPHNVDVEVGV